MFPGPLHIVPPKRPMPYAQIWPRPELGTRRLVTYRIPVRPLLMTTFKTNQIEPKSECDESNPRGYQTPESPEASRVGCFGEAKVNPKLESCDSVGASVPILQHDLPESMEEELSVNKKSPGILKEREQEPNDLIESSRLRDKRAVPMRQWNNRENYRAKKTLSYPSMNNSHPEYKRLSNRLPDSYEHNGEGNRPTADHYSPVRARPIDTPDLSVPPANSQKTAASRPVSCDPVYMLNGGRAVDTPITVDQVLSSYSPQLSKRKEMKRRHGSNRSPDSCLRNSSFDARPDSSPNQSVSSIPRPRGDGKEAVESACISIDQSATPTRNKESRDTSASLSEDPDGMTSKSPGRKKINQRTRSRRKAQDCGNTREDSDSTSPHQKHTPRSRKRRQKRHVNGGYAQVYPVSYSQVYEAEV